MARCEAVGVGIVGAGNRGVNNLAKRIAETTPETGLRVVALCDRRADRLREAQTIVAQAFAQKQIDVSPKGYESSDALIADPAVDLVMVTTPQCAHRAPAVAALQAGKKVYVDKPIAHTLEDAIAMVEEEARTGNPMLMGFTRRYEHPWRKAHELLLNDAIGPLHMVILRDIIPFHTFFHRWHRRREWSGGALNDKSSHHFDVMNWFANATVQRLSAFGGRRVFTPREDAPQRCLECDIDCPYRIAPTRGKNVSQEEFELKGDSWTRAESEFTRMDTCVYLPGADIKDHAMIQVAFDNGVVGSLIVSFFGPRAHDQETMELVGTRGRIMLNRHNGALEIISNYGDERETIDCRGTDFQSSHFGADLELARELRRFADGKPPVVSARHGYEATRLVMATHQAIDAGGGTVLMDDMPAASSQCG